MPCVCVLVNSDVVSLPVVLTGSVSLDNLNCDDCNENELVVCPDDTLSAVSVDFCAVDCEPVASVDSVACSETDISLVLAVLLDDSDLPRDVAGNSVSY